jgi:hypothetical protein
VTRGSPPCRQTSGSRAAREPGDARQPAMQTDEPQSHGGAPVTRGSSPPSPCTQAAGWLDWAYQLLASPTCDGCTACARCCAGPIPMWREEFEALYAFLHHQRLPLPARWPTDEWAPCPWLRAGEGRCEVYVVRPFICRAFGLVPWLPCPLGLLQPLPPALCRQLLAGYCSRPRRPFFAWLAIRDMARHVAAPIPTASPVSLLKE